MKKLKFLVMVISLTFQISSSDIDCNDLRMGQYICPNPAVNHIDPKTQQIRGCTQENKARSEYIISKMIDYSEY